MFKLPGAVAKRLVRIQREFLWGGGVRQKRLSNVVWSRVTTLKNQGGLGVDDLVVKNNCLLYKWMWRYSTQEGHLWQRLISAKCGVSSDSLTPSFVEAKASPIWRNIWRSGEATGSGFMPLSSGMSLKLGNGESVSFWSDSWSPLGCLKLRFPRLFRLSSFQSASVREVCRQQLLHSDFLPGWTRRLYAWESEICGQMRSALEGLLFIDDQRDAWVWRQDKRQLYTVHSAYIFLRTVAPLRPQPLAWLGLAPPKIEFFLWLALNEGVITREFLCCRGIIQDVDSVCPFCTEAVEDVSHLFFHCPMTIRLWQRLCRWWGVCWVPPRGIEAWIVQWPGLAGARGAEQAWMILGLALLWSIWLARNALIFSQVPLQADQLFDLVRSRALSWFKVLHPSFPYGAGAILVSPEPFRCWSSGKPVTIGFSA